MKYLFLLLIFITHQGIAMANKYGNVNFDFIKELEGFETTGYVPDLKVKHQSGVTVASGFDLGQRNENDLKGLPAPLIEKLKPYLGLKLADARNKLKEMPLQLSDQEAARLNVFAKEDTLNKLSNKWKATTGTDFDKLSPEKATVVASVAFQYGDLEKKTPNFWGQVTQGEWDMAKANLQDFGDAYGTRRNKEATYLSMSMAANDIKEYNDSSVVKRDMIQGLVDIYNKVFK